MKAFAIQLILAAILLCSCNKEDDVTISTVTVATEVSTYTAQISVLTTAPEGFHHEWGIALGTTPSPKDENNNISSNQHGGSFNYGVSLTDLTPNTTYFVQPWCSYNGLTFVDEVTSFETDDTFVPGEATISGGVYMNYNIADWNGAPPPFQVLDFASMHNAAVNWNYSNSIGQFGNTDNTVYSVDVDLGNGMYLLTIPTQGSNGNAVSVDYGILDFEGTRIINNASNTADSLELGIYSMSGLISGTSLTDGNHINQDFTLVFTPY